MGARCRGRRGKFAQLLVEFEIDLVEVEHSGDVERGLCLFVENVFGHVGFEAARKFRHVLHSQRETGGIGVSAEVFEQVGAALHRFVDVEARDGARRTGGHVARSVKTTAGR